MPSNLEITESHLSEMTRTSYTLSQDGNVMNPFSSGIGMHSSQRNLVGLGEPDATNLDELAFSLRIEGRNTDNFFPAG